MLSKCKKIDKLKCKKPEISELKNLERTLNVTLESWSGEDDFGCGIRVVLNDTFLTSNNIKFYELKPFYLPDSIISMGISGNDPIFKAKLLFTGNDYECISFREDPLPNSIPDTIVLPEVRVLSIVPL